MVEEEEEEEEDLAECTDGTYMEYYPSYFSTNDQWAKIPQDKKRNLLDARNSYKRNRGNNYDNRSNPNNTSNYDVR